jgi:hypothetical protein
MRLIPPSPQPSPHRMGRGRAAQVGHGWNASLPGDGKTRVNGFRTSGGVKSRIQGGKSVCNGILCDCKAVLKRVKTGFLPFERLLTSSPTKI